MDSSDTVSKRQEAERARKGIEVLQQKSEQHGAKVCTISGNPPDPDYADKGNAPQPVKANGQHADYYVLCDEERAKGFVRPVRYSYMHTGLPAPKYPLRDLTATEHEQYDQYGYLKFEEYPPAAGCGVGRYWTQPMLDRLNKGCGTTTSMGQKLAETYARDPYFYGATFCCACGTHFPVAEFVWEDGTVLGS